MGVDFDSVIEVRLNDLKAELQCVHQAALHSCEHGYQWQLESLHLWYRSSLEALQEENALLKGECGKSNTEQTPSTSTTCSSVPPVKHSAKEPIAVVAPSELALASQYVPAPALQSPPILGVAVCNGTVHAPPPCIHCRGAAVHGDISIAVRPSPPRLEAIADDDVEAMTIRQPISPITSHLSGYNSQERQDRRKLRVATDGALATLVGRAVTYRRGGSFESLHEVEFGADGADGELQSMKCPDAPQDPLNQYSERMLQKWSDFVFKACLAEKRAGAPLTMFNLSETPDYEALEDVLNRRKICAVEIKSSKGCFSRLVCRPMSMRRMAWDVIGVVLLAYDVIMFPLAAFDPPPSLFTFYMKKISPVYWTFDLPSQFFMG